MTWLLLGGIAAIGLLTDGFLSAICYTAVFFPAWSVAAVVVYDWKQAGRSGRHMPIT